MIENISLAFQGVWNHKLRSFLTMLGIIIGIASIMSIVSTIKGTNEMIKQNLVGSGTNAVKVQLYRSDNPTDFTYEPIPDGVPQINAATVKEVEKLSEVERATVYNTRSYAEGVFYKNTQFTGSLYGIDSAYLDVFGCYVQAGRAFTENDYSSYAKIALLDKQAVSTIFGGKNPLGKTMEISGEAFTIVGVIAESSEFQPTINSLADYYKYTDVSAGGVYIPGVLWPTVCRFDEPQSLAVRAVSTDAMTSAGKKAADILTATLMTSEEENYKYKAEDLLEQAKQLQDLSSASNKQLIWIASISLLVGGIGVMNIMLVSVTERTSEIGLKKAIGAQKRRILFQFLTEAAVLTSLGGILGVLAGVVMSQVVSRVSGTPTAISIPATLIAVLFSFVIGIVFGLLPAVKASNLNPIEALRRE